MLIASPKFLPDESPTSVLLRAADLNGWPTVQSMLIICRPLAPALDTALRSRERYVQYATRLGIDVPEKFGPYPSMRVYGERGVELPSGAGLPEWSFRPGGSALCPICLSEDEHPYLRCLWQIKICRTCPDHGCLLVESCEKCNEPLTWNRPAPHRCRCGFDLRDATRVCGDHDIARAIRDLISAGAHDRLNVFVRSYCVYVDALGIVGDSVAQDCLLRELYEGGDAIAAMLRAKITSTVSAEHPRLALLPVLKATHLKELAQSLLHELSDLVIPEQSENPPVGEIKLSDAAIALGISDPQMLILLCKERALEIAQFKLTPRGIMSGAAISRASCDALLRKLWRRPSDVLRPTQTRAPTALLIDFILNLLRHPTDNAGYDLEKGLSSLRMLATEKPLDSNETLGVRLEEFATYEKAAALLGVGKYLIPSLVKLGRLSGAVDPTFPVRKIVSRKSIAAFNKNYICSVKLARELGMKSTGYFVTKLKAAGILPVGGPDIDGSMVCILRRADLSSMDLLGVMSDKSKGRCVVRCPDRGDMLVHKKEKTISLVAVTKALMITLAQAKKLVNRSLLCRVQTPSLKVMVSQKSFDAFSEKWWDENLIDRHDAAAMVGERARQFIMRWVASGIVKTEDLGLRICVRLNDIEHIQMIKRRYVLATDCQKMWLVGRYELPNLEKRGLIHPIRLGLYRQARLYSRHEVERLLGPIRAKMDEV
jgi:hypothetical protein